MKRFLPLLLLTLFAATNAVAQANNSDPGQKKADDKPPKVGEQAPRLDLQAVLQAPAGTQANWDALRGKVVVLEFWSTT